MGESDVDISGTIGLLYMGSCEPRRRFDIEITPDLM